MTALLKQVDKMKAKIEKIKSSDDKETLMTKWVKMFGPETFLMKNKDSVVQKMHASREKCTEELRTVRNNAYCFYCSGRLPGILNKLTSLPIDQTTVEGIYNACAQNWYFNVVILYKTKFYNEYRAELSDKKKEKKPFKANTLNEVHGDDVVDLSKALLATTVSIEDKAKIVQKYMTILKENEVTAPAEATMAISDEQDKEEEAGRLLQAAETDPKLENGAVAFDANNGISLTKNTGLE